MNQDLIEEINLKPILHLNARNFEHFPEELKENGFSTAEIYLKWNNISQLPAWLGKLKSLTNLYLSTNLLLKLTAEIAHLENLEVLYIDDNKISTLPISIGLLHKLKTLNVNGNQLSYLPKELCQLQQLQCLFAADNLLESLPDELCMCQALEEIALDGNRLMYLPRAIVYLTALSSLSLARNRLHFLPAMPFTSMATLNIVDNPELNYASFELLHQKSSSNMTHRPNILHITDRCNTLEVIKTYTNCIQIHAFCSTKKAILHMPLGLFLYQCDLTKHQVPSLMESCMRLVYKIYFRHEAITTTLNEEAKSCYQTVLVGRYFTSQNYFFLLPQSVRELIEQGPVALCFSQSCREPIFTETVGWVQHTNLTELRHCVLFFCSTQCARQVFSLFLLN